MSEGQKKLGKYAILGVAGRGGMGTVYRGHDPVIDRKVAIKVYTASEVEFGSEIAQKMFLNEAQVVGALDHPNILRIYDAQHLGQSGWTAERAAGDRDSPPSASCGESTRGQ